MDIKKTILQHKQLCSLVSERRIKQSLDILSDMIIGTSSGDLRDEYENLVMTYRNMLSYTIEGINDPERNKVYLKLIQSILELSDQVRQDILSHNSGWNTYWVQQQTEKEQKLTGKTIIETSCSSQSSTSG
jgi:dynactin complex subunit